MADGYTKAVLTVIAAALCILVAQNLLGPARAYNELQKVQICDLSSCADLVSAMGTKDVLPRNVLPVTISNR